VAIEIEDCDIEEGEKKNTSFRDVKFLDKQ